MTAASALDSDTFEAQRPFLFGVAYRMLGSATEAEDIVQDAYLRIARSASLEGVRSVRSYLVTIVTRLCLDELKSARARREVYVGPWLPEPLPTAAVAVLSPEATIAERESISLAFLVLLERLSPLERAVFLLREVFDYDYAEIAAVVERTSTTCRQAFHRARARLEDGRPRFTASPDEHRRITLSFLEAAEKGNLAALTALLAEDVVTWTDGGGKAAAALNPIVGADRVARFVVGLVEKGVRVGFADRFEVIEVNGQPGLIWREPSGQPFGVFVFEVADGQITAIRGIRNPDKLTRFAVRVG
jgi:RNA polymerase sigma-70 factor (ECF subfamily)